MKKAQTLVEFIILLFLVSVIVFTVFYKAHNVIENNKGVQHEIRH